MVRDGDRTQRTGLDRGEPTRSTGQSHEGNHTGSLSHEKGRTHTKTLDTLAAYGSELTTEQLDDVDGGFVMLVIATLCVIDAGLWGYIAGKASASNGN